MLDKHLMLWVKDTIYPEHFKKVCLVWEDQSNMLLKTNIFGNTRIMDFLKLEARTTEI